MSRIFISYRSSDGKKDAARLASDMNERFGDELVFYDKQDLLGGSSWRDAIKATLDAQPIVLLLVTKDLLEACGPGGGRRIDQDDDPIRAELLAAHQRHAVILPLLTDGMQMPDRPQWPDTLGFLVDAHARPLRTDDWNSDLEHIVEDIKARHVKPLGEVATQAPIVLSATRAVVRRIQRWLAVLGGGLLLLVGIGLWLPHDPPPDAASPSIPQPRAGNAPPREQGSELAGVWWAIDPAGHRTRVQITLSGTEAVLQTDAIPVAWYPDWQAYALRLREQGTVFDQIRYSGAGPWADGRLEMPYDVHSLEGHGPLDTGRLRLALSADGRELTGELWSNGEQASTPMRLVRRP